MSKLLSAFTAQGNFDAELWYTTLFDEIPCKYSLSIEDEKKYLDPKEITFDKCKHLFSEIITIRQYTEEIEEDPNTEEVEFSIDLPVIEADGFLFNGESGSSLYIATEKKVFLIVQNKCIVFYSANDDLNEIKKFINKLWACFPKEKAKEKIARVGLIKYTNGEYYTSFSDIRKTTINIEENYNDDFIPVYNDTLAFLNQRESGLVLLYGKAGSGNFYRNNLKN